MINRVVDCALEYNIKMYVIIQECERIVKNFKKK